LGCVNNDLTCRLCPEIIAPVRSGANHAAVDRAQVEIQTRSSGQAAAERELGGGAQEATEGPEDKDRRGFWSRLFGG
jgi:hypothetical protein